MNSLALYNVGEFFLGGRGCPRPEQKSSKKKKPAKIQNPNFKIENSNL
jgi:hypothetical protein